MDSMIVPISVQSTSHIQSYLSSEKVLDFIIVQKGQVEGELQKGGLRKTVSTFICQQFAYKTIYFR